MELSSDIRMGRADAQVMQFVGIGVEIEQLGVKAFVVDVFPIGCAHHESTSVIGVEPQGKARWPERVVELAKRGITPGIGRIGAAQQGQQRSTFDAVRM